MKYFDVIPVCAESELIKCGVSPQKLRYCVKADLDGDGCYIDVYIAADDEELYILTGYERYGRLNRRSKTDELLSFDKTDFRNIPLDKLGKIYVW